MHSYASCTKFTSYNMEYKPKLGDKLYYGPQPKFWGCVPLSPWFKPLDLSHVKFNKKDGYRQQNVRQQQKLISIIDYDVCILEYLQPF